MKNWRSEAWRSSCRNWRQWPQGAAETRELKVDADEDPTVGSSADGADVVGGSGHRGAVQGGVGAEVGGGGCRDWRRGGTKEKLKELNDLAMRMEVLLQDAKEQKLALQKVPAWFRGWKSPWQGKLKGGE
ncbi:unnamed protein product [Camellia sinensis]